MDGAVTLALFFILQHLDSSNSHLLSGLQQHLQYNINTQKLFEKLQHCLSLCHWILHFLVDCPQFVKLHNLQSSTIVLNTGAPHGWVLSLLL